MKRSFFLALLLLSASASADEDGGAWEPTGTHENVETFRKVVPGSPLIAFMGKGVINAPLIKVASIMLDDDRSQEWVDSLKEAKVVRILNPSEYIELNYIVMPPLIWDRDFVTDVKMLVDPDTKTFSMLYHSTEDSLMPPQGKAVRGAILHSSVIMQSIENGTKTLMTAELHADPKGRLPAFLVNFFQGDWPIATFRGIRKQSARTDIKRPAVFADILGRVEQISR
jgi:hypothetical protein